MEIKLLKNYHSTLPPLERKIVTLIWGNDGWRYAPQLKTRQFFAEKGGFCEKWDGVIAMPKHIEQITWTLLCQNPKTWREQGETFDEVYEEIQTAKKSRQSTGPRQL